MTATALRPAAAFLRGVGPLAMVLAIIAGIFGMHVMVGNHTTHSTAAETHVSAYSTPDQHARDAVAPWPSSLASTSAPSATAQSCTCSGECASAAQMSATCVPSAKTGSLTAPDPGQGTTATDSAPPGFWARDGVASYTYAPSSPSPGDLSISRT